MSDAVATKNLVEAAVSAAMARVLPADLAGSDPLVRRSEHADFQSNIALSLAKQLRRPPRDLATELGRMRGVVLAQADHFRRQDRR